MNHRTLLFGCARHAPSLRLLQQLRRLLLLVLAAKQRGVTRDDELTRVRAALLTGHQLGCQ